MSSTFCLYLYILPTSSWTKYFSVFQITWFLNVCHSQSHYLFFVIWFADILFNYLHNFHISDYARSFKFFLLLSKQFFFYLLYIRYFFCRYSFFWPKEQYSFNVKCTYCRFNFCWLPQIPHAMRVRLAFWILILVSSTSTTLPKYLCGSNVWSEVYLWRLKYNFFHMLTLYVFPLSFV